MRKNIDPQIWGAAGWTFLRSSLRASDEDTHHVYVRWLHLLPEILPCSTCREHAALYLSTNPPDQHKDLVMWLDAFQDDVARRLRNNRSSSSYGLFFYTLGVFAFVLLSTCLFFIVRAQR